MNRKQWFLAGLCVVLFLGAVLQFIASPGILALAGPVGFGFLTIWYIRREWKARTLVIMLVVLLPVSTFVTSAKQVEVREISPVQQIQVSNYGGCPLAVVEFAGWGFVLVGTAPTGWGAVAAVLAGTQVINSVIDECNG